MLVHQSSHLVRENGKPLERAVLFLPGFADTFFQGDHADAWIGEGIEFYSLDARAQGRAGINLPALEKIYDLRLRHEETSLAIRYLREIGHDHITLLGHSTGGLQAAIYASDHSSTADGSAPDAVILNSPWFDLAQGEPVSTAGTWLAHALGGIAPGTVISTLGDNYPRWLHKDFGGEWDFDVRAKPVTPFPVRAGFLSSVRRLHAQVADGLQITAPVLVASASAHGDGKRRGSPDLDNTDVILDPADMVALAPRIGQSVTVRQFPGGVHDLACSRQPVRDDYTRAAIEFALAN